MQQQAEPIDDSAARTGEADTYTWKPLHLLNVYRLTLGALLVFLAYTEAGSRLLTTHDPALLRLVTLGYVLLGVISAYTIRWQRPAFNLQVNLQVFLDIVAIVVLMHVTGGVNSSLGMLLVVAIAGGGLLLPGRVAILYAALATLFVLAEQTSSLIQGHAGVAGYTRAGLLGAAQFATAVLAFVFARRIRESEALAEKRGVDLRNMAQLNDYIIQRLQSGIVVVDIDCTIRLMNESARHLLGGTGPRPDTLKSLAPELVAQIAAWRADRHYEPHAFGPTAAGMIVLPRFAEVGHGGKGGIVVFLDDTAVMTQQVQQAKLASLGRLAASIAHEIRNPLGAISHAGQLLAEAEDLGAQDRRLTEIILQQSKRVDAIVDNVLKLSRRERSNPQDFELGPWVRDFHEEFVAAEGVAPEAVAIEIEPADTLVRMDPGHLRQVVWNLCQNGLRYSGERDDGPRLVVRGGLAAESTHPYLEVMDFGPGIDPEVVQFVFEPFFTTEASGTGLGLYMARELCEFNQARIAYLPRTEGGSCFRITFTDPRRHVL